MAAARVHSERLPAKSLCNLDVNVCSLVILEVEKDYYINLFQRKSTAIQTGRIVKWYVWKVLDGLF